MNLISSAKNLFELEVSLELYLFDVLHGIILLSFLSQLTASVYFTRSCPVGWLREAILGK